MSANAEVFPLKTALTSNKHTPKTFAIDGLRKIKGDMEMQRRFLVNIENG